MHFGRGIMGQWGALTVLLCATASFAGSATDDALQDGLRHIADASYERAVGDFTVALLSSSLSPAERVQVLYNRGVAWDCVGEVDTAITDYSAALELMPDYAPARNNRANDFRLAGRLDKARLDYEAVLAMAGGGHDQSLAYAYYGLGAIAQTEKDLTTARAHFDRALMIVPGFVLAAQARDEIDRAYPDLTAHSPAATPADDSADADTAPVHLRRPVHRLVASVNDHSVSTRAATNCTKSAGPALRLNVPSSPACVREKRKVVPKVKTVAGDAAPTAVAASATTGGYAIQLGSYRNRDVAEAEWGHIVGRADGVLSGLSPVVVAADIPERGRFYRLRAVVDSYAAAADLCSTLSVRGLDCLAVHQ